MEPDEYERMYQVETQHWWYLGMQAITRALLNEHLSPNTNRRILDSGCGTGAASSTFLAEYGSVTSFDLSPLALQLCRTRGLATLIQASVTEIPFPADSFDLLTSFDVLYERAVIDDSAALTEFFRVLRPGGCLLLRLPAYNWLRGQHDRATHTARRYTVGQVKHLLIRSGFRLAHLTYANTILFPLALFKRQLEKLWPPEPNSSDLSLDMGRFNRLFKFVLSCEAPFVARHSLPFGLSVLALAQKPESV